MRITALAALLFATACTGVDYSARAIDLPAEIDLSQARVESYDDGSYSELEIGGSMNGALPRVGDFADAEGYGTVTVDRWQDYEYTNVQMNTLSEDGWAMVGVYIDEDPTTGETTWSTGSAIGCSGPEDGWAQFDEPPEDAELTAELVEIDGAAFIELTLEGDFRGNNEAIGVALIPAVDDSAE